MQMLKVPKSISIDFREIDATPPQMNRMKIELQYRLNQNKLNLPKTKI